MGPRIGFVMDLTDQPGGPSSFGRLAPAVFRWRGVNRTSNSRAYAHVGDRELLRVAAKQQRVGLLVARDVEALQGHLTTLPVPRGISLSGRSAARRLIQNHL